MKKNLNITPKTRNRYREPLVITKRSESRSISLGIIILPSPSSSSPSFPPFLSSFSSLLSPSPHSSSLPAVSTLWQLRVSCAWAAANLCRVGESCFGLGRKEASFGYTVGRKHKTSKPVQVFQDLSYCHVFQWVKPLRPDSHGSVRVTLKGGDFCSSPSSSSCARFSHPL